MQHLASTMEEHLVRVHSDIYFLYVKSWYGGVKLESICIPDLCALCTIWHHSVRSRWVYMYEVKGHFWGMCDLQSSLCMRSDSEVGIWCERCNWRSHMPRNWLLTSSILIVTSHHDVTSGVARWGQGGDHPLADTLPPSCPHEITLCTEVYGELPFWVPVSPPHLSPPCRPLILKSGYAPGCHTVTPYNFKAVLIFIDLAQLHFCLAHKNSHRAFFIVVHQWICKWWKTRC